MIKRFIKRATSTQEKRRLIENFFSLSVLQAANYMLPLITLPYLVRVLGVEKFGLVAFAQAFVQYFVILTDYGFNLSATRDVSIHRNDKEKLSKIVSSVFIIKGLLFTVSVVVLVGVLIFVPKFRADWMLYVFSFGVVFDNVLFPVWFFQGVEKMKYITIRNVIAKLAFTVLIFVFVREQGDYLRVPLINTLGLIVAGVFGVIPVFTSFNLTLSKPRISELYTQFVTGWHIFASRLAISLYTTTNTFVLGLFLNNTVVGYYAAAEKIVRMITQMFEPIFRAAYPHVAKKAAENKHRAVETLKKIFMVSFILSLGVLFAFVVSSSLIVRVVLGPQYAASLVIVRVLSPLLVIIPVAYILANLGLLSFKLDKYFLGIYLSGGFVNALFLCIFLGLLRMGGIGAAYASVGTELILTVCMCIILQKRIVMQK